MTALAPTIRAFNTSTCLFKRQHQVWAPRVVAQTTRWSQRTRDSTRAFHSQTRNPAWQRRQRTSPSTIKCPSRSFSSTPSQQHGHLEPPKPGEESVSPPSPPPPQPSSTNPPSQTPRNLHRQRQRHPHLHRRRRRQPPRHRASQRSRNGGRLRRLLRLLDVSRHRPG